MGQLGTSYQKRLNIISIWRYEIRIGQKEKDKPKESVRRITHEYREMCSQEGNNRREA